MPSLSPQDLLNLSIYSQLAIVFFAGVLTSLTPCVYPLIPITLSVFGARGQRSKMASFLLSLVYVLGISTTYTALGLISAATGAFFGSFLGNPWISLAIGLLLISFALAGLDLFHINFGSRFQNQANKVGGKGYIGAYLMGLVSGVIAAPCTGPILASILVIAGASGKPFMGSLLLFVHAFGLGLIFIILGTFSSLLHKIPKSGRWLNFVKFLTSTAILIVALFFLIPALKALDISLNESYPFILLIISLVCTTLLAIISMGQEIKLLKILSAGSLAIILFGLPAQWNMINPASYSSRSIPESDELFWHSSLDKGTLASQEANKIAMIDLYADWCVACKEYDKITFKDPRVITTLKELTLIRLDFTIPDEISEQIEQEYKIIGLPTILFLDQNGDEIPDSRITGFLKPEDFLEHLRKAKIPTTHP